MSGPDRIVEVSIRYETVVDDLAEAWAFIMDKIESVGPDPSVHIHPAKDGPPPMLQALMGQEVQPATRRFHVVVEGTDEEKRPAPAQAAAPEVENE